MSTSASKIIQFESLNKSLKKCSNADFVKILSMLGMNITSSTGFQFVKSVYQRK